MAQDIQTLSPASQKHAFIREGALVLYFDKAETPFVARFDLDSLAQASFEVTDKKDGYYYLMLRDYSVDAQIIGQFGSKTDAHQALYEILQALLTGKESVSEASCKKSKGWLCCLMKIIMWIVIVAVLLYASYILLLNFIALPPVAPSGSAAVAQQSQANPLSNLPEGEAVDADSILSPGFNAPAE